MTRAVLTLAITLALAASTARAADKAPAPAAPSAAAPAGGMPDMTKMGPLSRAVTKQDKKGIDDLYKAFEDAMMKGDVAAAADLCDFPIIMLSDDSKGVAKSLQRLEGAVGGHLHAVRDEPAEGHEDVEQAHADVPLRHARGLDRADQHVGRKDEGEVQRHGRRDAHRRQVEVQADGRGGVGRHASGADRRGAVCRAGDGEGAGDGPVGRRAGREGASAHGGTGEEVAGPSR